jgi:hypothetical protein
MGRDSQQGVTGNAKFSGSSAAAAVDQHLNANNSWLVALNRAQRFSQREPRSKHIVNDKHTLALVELEAAAQLTPAICQCWLGQETARS